MAILLKRFETWLEKAKHGDEHAYHHGRLSEDRREWKGGHWVRNEIADLADLAMAASERGDVQLFQVTVKRGSDTVYIARRIRRDTAAIELKTQAMRGNVHGRPGQRVYSVPMAAIPAATEKKHDAPRI